MKSEQASRIVLLDDHPIIMEGIATMLSARTDLEVVFAASKPSALLEWLDKNPADLLILDLCLGPRDGLDFLKTIHYRDPSLKILVFSMSDESDYCARVLAAGASGYVMKDNATKELIEAIDTVLAGGDFSKGLARPTPAGVPSSILSDRELSIFAMLGRGVTTREIASGLNLSIKTVEKHRENIKSKLGISNTPRLVTEAARWVLRNESRAT